MFKVGFLTHSFEDPDRRNWDDTGPRPISISCWYPVSSSACEEQILQPPDDPLYVMGRVAMNAPLSSYKDAFPVVLLSHGTGGTAKSIGWFARGLSATGYIVIAVDHHGNTASERYIPEGFLCWWERPRDLTIALDAMACHARFADRLDLARIVAAGFSLGGYTALSLAGAVTEMQLFRAWSDGKAVSSGPREFPDLIDHVQPLLASSAVFRDSWGTQSAPRLDPRIKAIVALAPAPTVHGFAPESLTAITMPVMLIVGGADREAPVDTTRWLHRHIANSSLHLLDDNVGHYVFLCEGTPRGRALEPDLWRDAPGIDRKAVQSDVLDLVRGFLADAVMLSD